MISSKIVSIFVRLSYPAHRQAALAELTSYLSLEQALLFVRRPGVAEFSLAAANLDGVAHGVAWQAFLEQCAGNGIRSELAQLAIDQPQRLAHGIGEPDRHCVLVLAGGRPPNKELTTIQLLLPFLAAKLIDEPLLASNGQMQHANPTRAIHSTFVVDDALALADRADTGATAQQLDLPGLAAAIDAAQHADELNRALMMSRHDLQLAYERAEQELAYRREAENRLRVADRRKDEFLATVSHELRTPLNAILGWAQVLKMSPSADSGQAKAIEAIIRNAKTQANLINDLLDTSSIVAGKIDLQMERLNLTDVLERARETVEPLADQKNIALICRYEIEDDVYGDAARLRQVFWNLLCNAIKFTPEGGSVAINADSDGKHVDIDIIDSGLGIEPGFLPFVFDRFRQADASLRRKYGGLGLGLSIARQFIEMHQGEISVASAGVGCGTTFSVRLPCYLDAAIELTDADERQQLATALNLKFMRVLTVDDDPDARELVRQMLQGFGAQVTAVGSALDALALLESETFDVLISDIAMPELDGIAFIGRVRSGQQTRRAEIPALALTAFSDPQRFTEAYAAGFNLVMTKPVIALELGQALSQMI